MIWRYRTNNQTLNEYDSDSIDLLRRLARVADTVEQRPPFASNLAYARELLQASRDQSGPSPACQPVQSTLAGKISHLYTTKLNRTDLAAETNAQFASLQPFFDSAHLGILRRSIDSHQIHLANTSAVTAVVGAVLMQIDHASPRVDTIAPLFTCASAAHNNGLPLGQIIERLQQLDGLSDGYDAARKFYLAQWRKSTGDLPGHDALRTEYVECFARVKRSDPAAKLVEHLGRWVQSQSLSRRSVAQLAAEAAHAGDMAKVAELYDLAAQESDSPDQTAAFRLISEGGRLKSNQIRTSDHVRESLHRLRADHVTLAKPIITPDALLPDLFTRAVQIQLSDPSTDVALQVADFAGDIHGGVALDHRYTSLKSATAAISDMSAVDALQRDPDILSVDVLKEALRGASFVWVSFSHDSANVEADSSYVNVVTLSAGEEGSYVRSVPIPDREDPIVRAALGRGSESLTDDQLLWLADSIFGDLSPASVGDGVYVIPDQPCWELPWSRIIPPYVRQYAAVPSAAAAIRLKQSQPLSRRAVIGLFNEQLPGATKEIATLKRLAAAGSIRFDQVRSAGELARALRSQTYDLLSITAHGTRDEGFNFSIDLGSEKLPLATLLDMQLPAAVSLACCWSARSTKSTTSVVAVTSCLLAGASTVVGGLWDVDDVATSVLLSHAYQRFADGDSLASALRAAFLSVDESDRAAAAGLGVVGRW